MQQRLPDIQRERGNDIVGSSFAIESLMMMTIAMCRRGLRVFCSSNFEPATLLIQISLFEFILETIIDVSTAPIEP